MSDPVQRQQALDYEARLAQEARIRNIKEVYGDAVVDDAVLSPENQHDPNASSAFTAKQKQEKLEREAHRKMLRKFNKSLSKK